MYELTMPAMSCNHCKQSITRAVQGLDASATLQFELPAHRLKVTSTLPLAALLAVLADAGYPATVVNRD